MFGVAQTTAQGCKDGLYIASQQNDGFQPQAGENTALANAVTKPSINSAFLGCGGRS
jgi:NOL1/NOP2/fmu family ribosome biogenesis protein